MTIPPLAARALALAGGCAAAGGVAYAARDALLAALLPAIGFVVDGLLPHGIARTALGVVLDGRQEIISLDAALTQPLQVGRTLVPAGEVLHASTLVAYVLQHVALIYAIFVAWPVETLHRRATLLLVGLPAAAVAALLDIPFVLAGLLHNLLLEAGATETGSRGLALYYEFLHRGGRAGISIAVAVAVCLMVGTRRAAEPASRADDSGRARTADTGGRAAGAQQPAAFE